MRVKIVAAGVNDLLLRILLVGCLVGTLMLLQYFEIKNFVLAIVAVASGLAYVSLATGYVAMTKCFITGGNYLVEKEKWGIMGLFTSSKGMVGFVSTLVSFIAFLSIGMFLSPLYVIIYLYHLKKTHWDSITEKDIEALERGDEEYFDNQESMDDSWEKEKEELSQYKKDREIEKETQKAFDKEEKANQKQKEEDEYSKNKAEKEDKRKSERTVVIDGQKIDLDNSNVKFSTCPTCNSSKSSKVYFCEKCKIAYCKSCTESGMGSMGSCICPKCKSSWNDDKQIGSI